MTFPDVSQSLLVELPAGARVSERLLQPCRDSLMIPRNLRCNRDGHSGNGRSHRERVTVVGVRGKGRVGAVIFRDDLI